MDAEAADEKENYYGGNRIYQVVYKCARTKIDQRNSRLPTQIRQQSAM